MKEFGQILKELRLEKNLSQEALGKILNVSRSSVARYENGLGLPPSDIVKSLCTYFNVDKDYLFPKENVEEIIVTKNKKIKFQKILLICSLCLITIGLLVGIVNIIPKTKLNFLNMESMNLDIKMYIKILTTNLF